MKKYLASLFLTTQIFAFAGIGVYGNADLFSVTPGPSSDGSPTVTVTPESLDGAVGGGLFFYLDVLPIIDLEANIELVGNAYKFTTNLAPTAPGEFPWGRVSGYFTLRKKIMGIGVPFLAKLPERTIFWDLKSATDTSTWGLFKTSESLSVKVNLISSTVFPATSRIPAFG